MWPRVEHLNTKFLDRQREVFSEGVTCGFAECVQPSVDYVSLLVKASGGDGSCNEQRPSFFCVVVWVLFPDGDKLCKQQAANSQAASVNDGSVGQSVECGRREVEWRPVADLSKDNLLVVRVQAFA